MLSYKFVYSVIGAVLLSFFLADSQSCAEYKYSFPHQYHALRYCQKSNKSVIGLTNVNSWDECAYLAEKRKAMAFNYAPSNVNRFKKERKLEKSLERFEHDESQEKEFFNCELLACPEFSNFSHMINDTRFDYYSLYTMPPPPINSTCIPAVGVFQYYNEFANYSTAIQKCYENKGSLAHILSERRTNSLSNFIYQQQNITRVKVAYVGLNETVRNKFRTSADEPIACSLFRAWAPGHPIQRKILRCVALTDEDSWQTFACKKMLPFICEIHTSGPPKLSVDFNKKCSVERDGNKSEKKPRYLIKILNLEMI